MITWTRDYAADLTAHLGGMEYKKSHSIVFPNGGLVEFITAKKAESNELRTKSHYKRINDVDPWE
tara:strand:+ start:146 stop:340 length:195 start_codon:yes stop_codon:yes gene_type:complete